MIINFSSEGHSHTIWLEAYSKNHSKNKIHFFLEKRNNLWEVLFNISNLVFRVRSEFNGFAGKHGELLWRFQVSGKKNNKAET
jgi:hypothetical protein